MFNNSIAMRFSESNTYQLCCHIIKNEEYRPSACVVGSWWVRSPHPPQGWVRQPPAWSLLAVASLPLRSLRFVVSAPLLRSLRSLPPPKAVGGLAVLFARKLPPAPPFCVPHLGHRSQATAERATRGVSNAQSNYKQ